MRVLTASDLTPGSANALRRAAALSVQAGGQLRIVHAVPATAGEDVAFAARDRLQSILRDVTGREAAGESGVSIRICHGNPVEVILDQQERYEPDLIVLGDHGDPRLRDAILGTTAGHVIREATAPVLVARIGT